MPQIKESEEHLNEVWINLLLNAKDAIRKSEHSVIKITTALNAEANAIEVSVQDNGQGISAEHVERVFNPFFTTKDYGQGTGLGLSICQDIIMRHSGSIRFESEGVPGRGATFTATLPLAPPGGDEDKPNQQQSPD